MTSSGIRAERPSAEYDLHAPQFRGKSPRLHQTHVDGWQSCAPANVGGAGSACVVGESATGLLLMASDLRPIYANAEAIQILAYPESPESLELLDGFLVRKIRSVLLVNQNDARSALATEFISGRRHYACRTFSLNNNNAPDHPTLAVILERSGRTSFDAAQVAAQFHLTPRERETLQYLTEGLTNKEIGHRMKISPNTVKAFLKLIMMKMGVSTRSGIIGKTVNPVLQRRSLLVASANYPFGE